MKLCFFPKHFGQKSRQNKVYFSSEIFSGRNDRLQFQLKFRIFSFFFAAGTKKLIGVENGSKISYRVNEQNQDDEASHFRSRRSILI